MHKTPIQQIRMYVDICPRGINVTRFRHWMYMYSAELVVHSIYQFYIFRRYLRNGTVKRPLGLTTAVVYPHH